MPRIIGVDIPGNKRIAFSLRYLYGIGPAKALEIIERVQIPEDLKAKDLTPDQIAAITKILQDDIVVEGDLRRHALPRTSAACSRSTATAACATAAACGPRPAHEDQCAYPQRQEDHDRRDPRQNPAPPGRQGLRKPFSGRRAA